MGHGLGDGVGVGARLHVVDVEGGAAVREMEGGEDLFAYLGVTLLNGEGDTVVVGQGHVLGQLHHLGDGQVALGDEFLLGIPVAKTEIHSAAGGQDHVLGVGLGGDRIGAFGTLVVLGNGIGTGGELQGPGVGGGGAVVAGGVAHSGQVAGAGGAVGGQVGDDGGALVGGHIQMEAAGSGDRFQIGGALGLEGLLDGQGAGGLRLQDHHAVNVIAVGGAPCAVSGIILVLQHIPVDVILLRAVLDQIGSDILVADHDLFVGILLQVVHQGVDV